MLRFSPLWLLGTSGCLASSSLFEGPAVWGVMLAGRAEVGGLPLTTGVAAALVADIEGGEDLEQSLVEDAEVRATAGSGPRVRLAPPGSDGMYRSSWTDARDLHAAAGQAVAIEAEFGGQTHELSSVAIEPAVIPLLTTHTAGEELVIPLPDDLDDAHDGVLSQVFDEAGEAVWEDFPTEVEAWLDILDGRKPVPRKVRIPGSVLAEPQRYTVAIYAIREDTEVLERSAGLSSQLSGFMTGSALITPVEVRP